MKFTDGFWITKPGIELFNCAQVQDARWEGDAFTVYCSYTSIVHRGMTLTGPMLTLRFTAPRQGILSVKMTNYEGISRKEPRFALNFDGGKAAVEEDGDTITVSSGTLSAVITKQEFSLRFYEGDRELTGFGARHLGCAQDAGRMVHARQTRRGRRRDALRLWRALYSVCQKRPVRGYMERGRWHFLRACIQEYPVLCNEQGLWRVRQLNRTRSASSCARKRWKARRYPYRDTAWSCLLSAAAI